MQINDELMTDLGFVKTEKAWVDSHIKIYFDQMPTTLKEVVGIMTGNAHNKGVKKGMNLEASIQSEEL